MITLAPLILEILMKLVGYFLAKQEEKAAAEKDLIRFFKTLDHVTDRASNMRDRYDEARERIKNKA